MSSLLRKIGVSCFLHSCHGHHPSFRRAHPHKASRHCPSCVPSVWYLIIKLGQLGLESFQSHALCEVSVGTSEELEHAVCPFQEVLQCVVLQRGVGGWGGWVDNASVHTATLRLAGEHAQKCCRSSSIWSD